MVTPAEGPSSTTYLYDPANTVSSNGRCIISYGPSAGKSFAGMGPQDQIQFETLSGHGRVWLQTMPLSNLARKLGPSLGATTQGGSRGLVRTAFDVLDTFS